MLTPMSEHLLLFVEGAENLENTTPPREIIATSVVPPPISIIIDPFASIIGRLVPIAAAKGSSMRNTFLAPAARPVSKIAFLSTGVELTGTQIISLGLNNFLLFEDFLMKYFIKCSKFYQILN